MQLPTIRLRRSPGAAWIVLDRAVALNAINVTMVADLNQVLDALEAEPALRAVVLTGSGASFCAGADLKESRERATRGDTGASARFLESVRRLTDRIAAFPRPVIAAVNGTAAGGGLELMLACDLAIAVRSAKIGDAHANYGLLPGGGGSARLPRRIGVQRAKYLMYTGQFVPAQTLCDWGLLIAVAEDGMLETQTSELVERLSGKSPLGLARMKQLVDDGLEQSLTAALRTEQTTSALHAHSFDRSEGLAAFAEKRPPRFEGR